MSDPTDILVSGVVEASKQFTIYIALGLSAAISALVPALDELADSNLVKVQGASIEVPLSAAR